MKLPCSTFVSFRYNFSSFLFHLFRNIFQGFFSQQRIVNGMKTLQSKNVICSVIQNPLALRSTRAFSCILPVLFDELSSESESSDGSILMIFCSCFSVFFMSNGDKFPFLTCWSMFHAKFLSTYTIFW